MGFFNKRVPKETNEIENRALKEKIANAAISQLHPGDDYESLAYTKVEFGYLYNIESHGIEALFKVITDKGTFYFAVQGPKMLSLALTEELYKAYVDGFFAARKK
ncbi:MAG: hypothetical protein MJ134_11060 [Lachnospiraceae bacterium]|nr:hypothetical protein [Lachnospiraceae bacterium]